MSTSTRSDPTTATAPRRARRMRGLGPHIPLMLTVIVLLFPFYWTVVMATNASADFYAATPKLVPGPHLLDNIRVVFSSINFFGSMTNTIIVATSVTVLVLFFDSLAAFAFAKFTFPGSRVLFAILLLTFTLPAQLSTVSQFVLMINLGLVGTLQALIIPAAANAFGIFWMRQYITGAVPDELLDAGTIDGCGFFRQYYYVVLPIIRPGLAFLGIFTFVGAWNDYGWPLIVLVNPDRVTLQVALAQLNLAHGTDYSVVMAGALLAIIPLVLVFLIFARQFVADAVKGAVRG